MKRLFIPWPHPFQRANSEILAGLLNSPIPPFICPSLVWELNCYTVILFCIKKYFFLFLISRLRIPLWNYFTILLKTCSLNWSWYEKENWARSRKWEQQSIWLFWSTPLLLSGCKTTKQCREQSYIEIGLNALFPINCHFLLPRGVTRMIASQRM